MKEDSLLTWAGCIVGALVIPFIVVSAIMNGLALSILWDWFVVPLFDVVRLSIPQAIGLAMIVSFLTYRSGATEKVQGKNWALLSAMLIAFLHPVLVVAIAWVVTWFL